MGMIELLPGLLLGICAWEDIKHRRIHGGIALSCLFLGLFLSELSMNARLTGLLCGAVLALIPILTRGRMGSGDGMTLLGLAPWLGPSRLLLCLFLSLGIFLLFGGIGVLLRKMRGKTKLPFLPFLLLGYLSLILF